MSDKLIQQLESCGLENGHLGGHVPKRELMSCPVQFETWIPACRVCGRELDGPGECVLCAFVWLGFEIQVIKARQRGENAEIPASTGEETEIGYCGDGKAPMRTPPEAANRDEEFEKVWAEHEAHREEFLDVLHRQKDWALWGWRAARKHGGGF